MSDPMQVGKVELPAMPASVWAACRNCGDLYHDAKDCPHPPMQPPKPPKRVAVQFLVGDEWTTVLANDGTMWDLINGRWTRLPDLPQD